MAYKKMSPATPTSRRSFLRSLVAVGAWAVGGTATLLQPLVLWAAQWNKKAFEAQTLSEAMKFAEISTAEESKQISIKAPEIAENGAVVPVEIDCGIAGARQIFIFAEKNPQPFVAKYTLAENVESYISTRIKMGETAHIRVVVNSGGRFFAASKEVKVTIGGCG